MAIPSIGLSATLQYSSRSAELRENQSRNDSKTAVVTSGGDGQPKATQPTSTAITLFPAVTATPNINKSTTSRRDLADLEAIRNRQPLQGDSRNLQSKSGRALQSFLEVADFERKDELTNLYGIDIFI